jgi:microcystin-dependent protein
MYPLLYEAIGYTYGMDGSKYRVPDTRGVFMRGMDPTVTRDANRPAGSIQLDMLAYDGGNVNEIGIVAFYAVNKPPANWLACDGAVYQINLYQPLYNVIGNLYGGAAGSTFAVPDLRGVFIRGFDPTGTTDVDRQKGGFGARQGHMFQSHNHGGVMRHPGGMVEQEQDGGPNNRSNYNQGTDHAGGSETRPVNIALLPCIRFR